MSSQAHQLDALHAVIAARKGADPAESYTARLLAGGPALCARKLGEEAVETLVAAVEAQPDRVISESADLLYHWLVLLAALDIDPGAVYAELARREGQSGLEEKAERAGVHRA